MKPAQWGSPLVQEKYQKEKVCDKRHPYLTIIIFYNVCTIGNNRNVSPMNIPLQTFGKAPECRELTPLNVVLLNAQSDGTNINNCAFRGFRFNPN